MKAPLSALCERSDYMQTGSFELLFELNGEIVQLQLIALNDDYNNFSAKNQTRTTFQSP